MAKRLNIPLPHPGVKLRRDAEVTLPPPDEWGLKGVGCQPGKSGWRKAEPRQYCEPSGEQIVEVIQLPRKAS